MNKKLVSEDILYTKRITLCNMCKRECHLQALANGQFNTDL